MKQILFFIFISKMSLFESFVKDRKHFCTIDNLKLVKESGLEKFPDKFFLDLFEFGKNFSGFFSKTDRYLIPAASHFLNGKLNTLSFDEHKDHQTYQDKNSRSFATVYHKDNNLKIYARFFDNKSNIHFDLIPDLNSHSQEKNTHFFFKQLDESKKRSLINQKKRGNLINDQLFVPGSNFTLKNIKKKQLIKAAQSDSPVILDVETLVVLDPTIYQDHKAYLNSNDDAQIFQHMRRYYAHIFNGVNQKYQNSLESDPDLRINIVLVHLLILTNPSDATWTNVNIVGDPFYKEYEGKEVVLISLTLDELQKFVEKQNFNFEFDHVAGLFNKDLWTEDYLESAEIRSSVVGAAWIGMICNRTLKYSVTEDNIGFTNLYIIAHEIGHNLGSLHDTIYEGNYCLADDDYIMSPTANFENIINKQLFSFCSVSYFKQALLLDDGSDRASCLFNRATAPSYVQSANYEQTGKIWSLDQQCKIQNGLNSTACKNVTLQAQVCSKLYCQLDLLNCKSKGPAVEGSSCGTNKICQKGLCMPATISNSASVFSYNLALLLISIFFNNITI